MNTNKNSYEKRIVAYGDIIGWKEAIKEKPFEFLIKIINKIDQYKNVFSPDNKIKLAQYNKTFNSGNKIQKNCKEHAEIEFSFFSDNFAISVPITDTSSHVFGILAVITDKLLHHKPQPFLVRGGVAFGDLFHRADTIFGPALVEAVEIEKMALYPRFLCSDKLIEYLNNTTYKKDVLFQNDLQEWMVNTARGSLDNCDALIKILDTEIQNLRKNNKPLKHQYKWQYMRIVLPKMFEQHEQNCKEEIIMANTTENICGSISSSFKIGDLVYLKNTEPKSLEKEMRIIQLGNLKIGKPQQEIAIAECTYVKWAVKNGTTISEEKKDWFPLSELVKAYDLKLCEYCRQVMNYKDTTKCAGCNASLS